jgi:hypothetical protein
MKKLWDNPELTVLVKRKSDEVILTNCKSSGLSNTKGQCFHSPGVTPCKQ